MSKIKEIFKNISPLNNRTEMPVILYIIKIGEGVSIALHFACGKNPLKGEMFDYKRTYFDGR